MCSGFGVPQFYKDRLAPTIVYWTEPKNRTKKAGIPDSAFKVYLTMDAGVTSRYLRKERKQFSLLPGESLKPDEVQSYSIAQIALLGGKSIGMLMPLPNATVSFPVVYLMHLDPPLVMPTALAEKLYALISRPTPSSKMTGNTSYYSYEQHMVDLLI
jgi:hypothetical protein